MKKTCFSFAGACLLATIITTTLPTFAQTSTGGGTTTVQPTQSGGGGGGGTTVVPTPISVPSSMGNASRDQMVAVVNSLLAIISEFQKQINSFLPHSTPEPPEVVVSVSDPGQPKNKTVALGVLEPYTVATLTMSDSEFAQSVYLTVQKRGLIYDVNPELYLSVGEKSINYGPFRLNENGQALVGPISVQSGKGRAVPVQVFAKLDTNGKVRENDPPSLGFDVTGVSVDGYTTVQKTVQFSGRFPILGATHIIDPSLPTPSLAFLPSRKTFGQNIMRNTQQTFGGFRFIASGEGSTYGGLVFSVRGTGNLRYLTQIVLVDENGNVVAGPFDVQFGEKDGDDAYLWFADEIRFQEGEHDYSLRGRALGSFSGSLQFSLPRVNPSQPAQGLKTGSLFFPTTTTGWGPEMIVRGPSKIQVSVHNSVASKFAIAGSMGIEGLELVVNGTQANSPVGIRVFGGLGLGTVGLKPTDTHYVQLYDGIVPLNNGSNVLKPSSNGPQQITPDSLFIIQSGMTKSLKLKENISAGVTGSMAWSLLAGGIHAVDLVTGEEAEVEVIASQGPLIQVVKNGDVLLQMSATAPTTARTGTFTKIAAFDTMTTIEGVSDGVLQLSIESSGGSINQLGSQAGLVVGGLSIGGFLKWEDDNLATVTFSLNGVSIPAHSSVLGTLYLDTGTMPAESTLTVSKEVSYTIGQVSGVRISPVGLNQLGKVTITR